MAFPHQGARYVPPEPILHDFNNINVVDAVLTWDGYPVPKVETQRRQSASRPIRTRASPTGRRPSSSSAIRRSSAARTSAPNLGDAYAETLWAVHKDINDSADFVMYWWDRAAGLLTAKGTKLQRFGFVTTNSITQTFSRRVVAQASRSQEADLAADGDSRSSLDQGDGRCTPACASP